MATMKLESGSCAGRLKLELELELNQSSVHLARLLLI